MKNSLSLFPRWLFRRGLKPTGIAIYDAIQQGFKSVGHLLQV